MDPPSASQPLAFIKPHARFHLVSLIQLFKSKADLTLPPAEWLEAMKIGIASDGELFALAHDRFLALLPRATADDPVTHLIDAKCREGEKITDLVVITVKEDRKAWNFVILGYNTGMVRAFSESGDEVFAHCFHKAPVVRMHLASCTSAGYALLAPPYLSARSIFAGFSENFSILYGRVLVVIVGASLYYILMTYVRMGQNAASSSPSSIDVRKIALEGLLDTTDFMSRTSIGLNDASSTAHTVITVGSNPIIAFYEAHSKQAGQSDGGLLKLVSSSLTSWWGSSKPEPKNPLELVPITSSCLAPTGHLAVTADELGRVLLLDVRLNVVCRMWKGYRDAQCGWLFGCSQDEPSNQAQMYLVIYTPRRGILEVWRVRHGDRVAAFNVGTNLRLLYCSPFGPTKWKHPRCFLLRLDLTFTEVVFRAPLVSRPVTIVHVPDDEAVSSSSSSSSSPSSSPPSSADNTPSNSPAVTSKIIASSTPPTTIASMARAPGSTPPNEPGSTPGVKGRPLRGLSLTKAIRVPDPRVSPRSYHHPVPPQDPTAFEIAPPSTSPERHSSLVSAVAGDTAPTQAASDTATPPP